MPAIVHFDVAADDTERAKRFYEKLFDRKMEIYRCPCGGFICGNPPQFIWWALAKMRSLAI